jgi:hypothetical protein
MEFFFSSEVDQSALHQMFETRAKMKPLLEEMIAGSSLADLDVEVRYVPIIMKVEDRAHYPARSRVRRKERVYSCAPQLDIEPFLTGTPSDRFAEYIGGLRECGPALAKLGATEEQAAEFNRILVDLFDRLVEDDG